MSRPADSSVGCAIVHVTLVVRDHDEAIAFYCGVLGFELVEDTHQPEQDKRWVVVAPRGWSEGRRGVALVLGKASNPLQVEAIGAQTGGRVFLFLQSTDFRSDYQRLVERGVRIVREPAHHEYGQVAVFADLYRNLWDLVEFAPGHRLSGG